MAASPLSLEIPPTFIPKRLLPAVCVGAWRLVIAVHIAPITFFRWFVAFGAKVCISFFHNLSFCKKTSQSLDWAEGPVIIFQLMACRLGG